MLHPAKRCQERKEVRAHVQQQTEVFHLCLHRVIFANVIACWNVSKKVVFSRVVIHGAHCQHRSSITQKILGWICCIMCKNTSSSQTNVFNLFNEMSNNYTQRISKWRLWMKFLFFKTSCGKSKYISLLTLQEDGNLP